MLTLYVALLFAFVVITPFYALCISELVNINYSVSVYPTVHTCDCTMTVKSVVADWRLVSQVHYNARYGGWILATNFKPACTLLGYWFIAQQNG